MWNKPVDPFPRDVVREWTPPSIDALFKVMFSTYGYFLFRGQADASWPLASRLARAFPAQATNNEFRMMQVFKADAHMLTTYTPRLDARLEWLALAQHHGAPTRLVDWSQSPFVALFFATCDESTRDGSLWILDPSWATQSSRYVLREEGVIKGKLAPLAEVALSADVPALLPVVTRPRFPRLVAQAGQFTLIGGNSASVEESILRLAKTPIKSAADPGIPLRKVRIRKRHKANILDRLSAMQITAATIYPDIEGLAKSLPQREWLDWSAGDSST